MKNKMKNKMFEMIIDAGDKVYKAHAIGINKKDIMERYSGNGEFVTIKDVTEDFPISEECVCTALRGFEKPEVEAVISLLHTYYENVPRY